MNLVAIRGLAAAEASLQQSSSCDFLVSLLEAGGAKVDWIDLRALAIPFYDGDIETGLPGLPASAQELVARIARRTGS